MSGLLKTSKIILKIKLRLNTMYSIMKISPLSFLAFSIALDFGILEIIQDIMTCLIYEWDVF